MATAVYQRASDKKQDEDGISIETQEEHIRRFCEYKGFTNIKKYTEIRSARSTKGRVELERLLADIKKGHIKKIVIYKLDRLTRNLRDLMNILHFLDEYDCELHSTIEELNTKSPTGKMAVQMLGIVAEWESGNTSLRVKNSMQLRFDMDAVWQSVAPYGFKLGKKKRLVLQDKESSYLREAYDLVFDGMSFSAAQLKMVKDYNLDWEGNFLSRKLGQPSLVGHTLRNGKIKKNTHEGILTEKERDKLVVIRDKNRRTRTGTEYNDLFRRKLICPVCKNIMHFKTNNGRIIEGKKTYDHAYGCHVCLREGRPQVNVSERMMVKAFNKYMKDLIIINLDQNEQGKGDDTKKLNKLTNRMAAIGKERDRVQRAWIKNMMSDEDLEKYQSELDEELLKIEENISNLNKDVITITKKEVSQLVEHFNTHFDILTQDEKRLLIQRHVNQIRFERQLVKGYKQKYDVWISHVKFF